MNGIVLVCFHVNPSSGNMAHELNQFAVRKHRFAKQSRLPVRDKIRKSDVNFCPVTGVFDGTEKVGHISKSVT